MACFLGAVIYTPFFYFGVKLAEKHKVNSIFALGIIISLASLAMCFCVIFLNGFFFNNSHNYGASILNIYPKTFLLGTIISVVILVKDYIKRQDEHLISGENETLKKDSLSKFMQQLPHDMRGELYCLEKDDHYLKVHTAKGSHMILMRMKDAVILLESYKGLQVHRSWWVAEDAVERAVRDGRKTWLELACGIKIPVSRTYFKEVKRRNLL